MAMRASTQIVVDDSIEEWRKEYIKSLTVEVYRAYLAAGVEATNDVGAEVDWMLINSAAQAYAKEYGEMLTDDGASIISGEKVYWLRDMTERRRSEVAAIIEEGLAKGKPTGVRERTSGGYPKGTIARDLEDYFGDRRSHASTVARTELGRIQNVSRLDRWTSHGWDVVRVQDGDGANPCEICQEKNGQVWTIAYAQAHELEHPNCVRNFYPLRPEDYEGEVVIGA